MTVTCYMKVFSILHIVEYDRYFVHPILGQPRRYKVRPPGLQPFLHTPSGIVIFNISERHIDYIYASIMLRDSASLAGGGKAISEITPLSELAAAG